MPASPAKAVHGLLRDTLNGSGISTYLGKMGAQTYNYYGSLL